MSNSSNLSSVLEDILRRDSNSLEILTAISELASAETGSIVIRYKNADGTETELSLPSYKYLLSEINKLSKNFESLTKSDAIVIKDGDGNNISFSRLTSQDKPYTIVSAPSTFSVLASGAEQMLNPLLNMEISMASDADRYMVQKLLLTLDSDVKKALFGSTYLDKVVDYAGVRENLIRNNIAYTETEFEINSKRKKLDLYGFFDVMNSRQDKILVSINGENIEKDVVYYKLSTLYYFDAENRSIHLKKDDALVTTGSFGRYVVASILTETNEVSLRRDQGFGGVEIGVEKLAMAPKFTSGNTALLPVTVNEYAIYFIKPVNVLNNSVPNDWRTGFGVFTSNIKLNGSDTTLADYYNTKVRDMNRTIEYVTNDQLVPLTKAVTPNVPILNAADFKVIQINAHKDDASFLNAIKTNLEQKDILKKEIDLLDKNTAELKTSLNDKSTVNETLLKQTQVQITDKLKERATKVDQYNSLVTNLASQSQEIAKFSPKYAARGFITIPEPVYEDPINQIGKQETVQFLVGYRYLSKDNTANNTKTFKQTVDGKTVSAEYGTWVEFKTKPRTKEVVDGSALWSKQKLDSSDIVNFNQISIAISNGENLEIRVKALTEAGFPYSPHESEWSESVIIPFPDEFAKSSSASVENIGNEQAVVEIKKALEAMGVSKHLADSLSFQDRDYVHQASNIITSIADPSGRLYDADGFFKALKATTEDLYAILNKSKSKVAVTILDVNGKTLNKVNNFDSIKLFGGYYVDEVSELTVPKGEIITKVYYVNISNEGETDLELLPYQPGVLGDRLAGITLGGTFPDDASYFGYMFNKSEYDSYRKYHRVPLSLSSVLNDNDLYTHYTGNQFPYFNTPPFQSEQSKGQYIYSRYMDISLTNRLYEKVNLTTLLPLTAAEQLYLPTDLVNGVPSADNASYVWAETMNSTGPNGNGVLSDFCVHTDHPDLKFGSEFFVDFVAASYSPTRVPKLNVGGTNNNVKFLPFAHNYYFNIEANKPGGTQQLEYIPFQTAVTPGFANFARKIGFTANDKYLIGQNTCGSYLFMSTPTYKSLYTGSAIYSQGFVIKKGDAVRVPVHFQFRMTDYDGAGSAGPGNIGGYGRLIKPTNLTYTKRLGIDFVIKDDGIFSFDIEATAKYKPDSVSTIGVNN